MYAIAKNEHPVSRPGAPFYAFKNHDDFVADGHHVGSVYTPDRRASDVSIDSALK
jgi:hypothetical protein